MTINSPAAVRWAMYLAVAEQQGVDWQAVSGTLQNDILKEYIAQKEYTFPPRPSMRLVTETIEFGPRHTPAKIEGRCAVIIAGDATVKAGCWWPGAVHQRTARAGNRRAQPHPHILGRRPALPGPHLPRANTATAVSFLLHIRPMFQPLRR